MLPCNSQKEICQLTIWAGDPSTHPLLPGYKQQTTRLTVGSLVEAVDAKMRVLLFDLSGLDLRQGLDGGLTAVFCQRQGNSLQSLGKRPHSVLFQCGDLMDI